MADIVMFLVQMELAISGWIRSKNDREATNDGTMDWNSIQPRFGRWEKKENKIPRVADNAAVRLQAPQQGAPHSVPDWHDPRNQASVIRTMCKFLRARDIVFGDLVYSDPSWEIILLLHAARTEGVKVGFSELEGALSASSETLTRCLTLLETKGLVLRAGSHADAALTLDDCALAMIEQSFAQVPSRETRVWANQVDGI